MKARALAVALLAALLAAPASAQFEWSAPADYPASRFGSAVAAGDVDGDGYADVVLASAIGGTVEILYGDGAGGFRAGALATIGTTVYDVALSDLDRDGRDEILVSVPIASVLRVLTTDPRGGIAVAADYPLTWAYDITVADEDGDGLDDVLAAYPETGGGPPSGIGCWHGDGAGGFVRYRQIVTGGFVISVAAGDWNGDGLLDLAVSLPRLVQIRLADGTGAYPSAGYLAGPFFETPSVAAGDLDSDGLVDLAVTSSYAGGSTFGLFAGLGTGAFSRFYWSTDSSREWTGVAVVDLDLEAGLDVMVAEEVGPRTLLSDGGREFVDMASLPPNGGTLAVADFDSDGYPDAATERRYKLNRCHEARRGSVNAGAGPAFDVLFVNGLPGDGRARAVSVGRLEPLILAMEAPLSRLGGPSRFALYAWNGAEPTSRDAPRPDGLGVGRAVLPMPFTSGEPQPSVVWNNLRGTEALLGFPDRPSRPAPAFVAARPAGLGRPAKFFLQGLIRDAAAPNGVAAMTNAIQVIVR